MKRMIIAVAVMFAAGLSAHADTTYWTNILKKPRTRAATIADANKCARIWGTPMNGGSVSAEYKQCMLSRGWQFAYSTRYWVDHDGSKTCVHAMFMGMPSVDCKDE